MRGAIDEGSIRLARALQRPPETVEAALLEVGVDAPYLSRALLEGDPQGALAAVSQRLNVTRRQLSLAVLRASGAPPAVIARVAMGEPQPADAPFPPQAARPMARMATRGAVAAGVVGALLLVAASLYLWAPSLFVEFLLALGAALLVLAGGGLLLASWRLARAAAKLRRMR